MKTKTAVILTIFIYSLVNVLIFKLANIPQGCYTLTTIVTGLWLVLDYLFDKRDEKNC